MRKKEKQKQTQECLGFFDYLVSEFYAGTLGYLEAIKLETDARAHR